MVKMVRNLSMESMLLIKFGRKPRVKNYTATSVFKPPWCCIPTTCARNGSCCNLSPGFEIKNPPICLYIQCQKMIQPLIR